MPAPTPDEIDAYESAPAQFAAAIEGLSDAQLQRSPAPGEWSIREVLIHMPDSEIFVYERIRRILAEDKPILHAFPEEMWAAHLNYGAQNYKLSLDLLAALRHSNAALLRSLPAAAWERTGMHSERGEMSLFDIFTVYLAHGKNHLKQVEQIKATL
ncbi:MAG TPA: DinB family protein [Ktedonobacteraceae bacterium]|nr:DinB family protein [Ktedonobacteraceae bacterium]